MPSVKDHLIHPITYKRGCVTPSLAFKVVKIFWYGGEPHRMKPYMGAGFVFLTDGALLATFHYHFTAIAQRP